MSIWTTPGLQEALEQRVGDGLTAAQVARELSFDFKFAISRLAVIGRVARTPGLYLKTLPCKKKIKPPPAPKKVAAKVRVIICTPAPDPLGDIDGGCKWPMWTDKVDRNLFCGHAKGALATYCQFHDGISWRPGKQGLAEAA